jgi:hypothetical protein
MLEVNGLSPSIIMNLSAPVLFFLGVTILALDVRKSFENQGSFDSGVFC